MSDKQQRARLASHELQITEEAHAKLRVFLLEQAVALAGSAKHDEAINMLLQVKALDTIRMMVRTPVEDWEIEKALEDAKASANTPN